MPALVCPVGGSASCKATVSPEKIVMVKVSVTSVSAPAAPVAVEMADPDGAGVDPLAERAA